ncbi:hypothetical protein SELMODRAFT_160579 [Selaginella moellendorffii]|uniref:Uncharacterized protein n=1 Tax=Selaginella moellendorffii TaxID=88036 RepID=D8T381_SELML|nr:hypothetical protein SELMODRAFT_160579 [Selaginella moellendorffii]
MSLAEVYACMPSVERGRGILVDGDARSSWIIYCNGRSVVIRSLVQPLLVDVYCQHAYPVSVARISPNAQWIASADVSGIVRIWGATGDHILRHEYTALSGRIDDLQWSHDGQRIVVCGDGKGKSFVRAFSWDTGTSIGDFEGSSKRVLSCAFKPTRPFRIATGGEDFVVNFYEGPPFKFTASHRDHTNFVNCVRFAPDGTKFVTAGSDKKLIVFDGKTGSRTGLVSSSSDGHTGSIYAVSWNASSSQVVTVSADKTAKLWSIAGDGSGGSLEATFCSSDVQLGCLWLNDSIVTFSLDGRMNVLSATGDLTAPDKVLSGHSKSITAVSASGTDIYSSSYDGVIVKWRLGEGFVARLDGNGFSSSVSGLRAVAGSEDTFVACGQTKVWYATFTRIVGGTESTIDLGAACVGFSIAPCRDGEVVLACTEQELILLRDFAVVSRLSLRFTATAVAVSPDAKAAVVGDKDGKLHLFSLGEDGLHQEALLERHRASVTALEFSPDGTMFASGDQNREAFVWDAVKREVKLKNMLYHTTSIQCIAWAVDSSKVATGGVDGCIYVYYVDRPASARISIRGAHPGGVSGLAFADVSELVSGGQDAFLRVWKS